MSKKSEKLKNKKNLKPLKVRDNTDSYATNIPMLFDLPMRLLINGRSGSGKSNMLVNLLLNDNYPYKRLFDGDNIYLFSPEISGDRKLSILKEELDIPDENAFEALDDELLSDLYDGLVEDYKEKISDKEKPENVLIVIDDFSSSGAMSSKRFNKVSQIFCNGRKFLISIVVLQQSYLHTNKTIRENATGLILFNTSQRALETIEGDNNYLKSKKQFLKMFRENVTETRDFLVINYSNPFKELYLNSCFEPIDTDKYLKK
jgi:hypothetical protein